MAKCYLHDIVDPDSKSITEDHWPVIYKFFDESSWIGEEGNRIGVVNPIRHKGVIAGYFAQEGRKKTVQYDDNKEQIDVPPIYSFEHLFFALLETPPQLLIQNRNIYDYLDLSLGAIRDNLLRLLFDVFRSAGIYIVGKKIKIESAGMEFTNDQMYNIFTRARKVTKIQVSNLQEAKYPTLDDPRYKLFNPKDEWNSITWGAVSESVDAGLDEIRMISSESLDSTLKSPIPKSFAASGNIDLIEGMDESGRIFYREQSQVAELTIDLPLTPETNPDIIEQIFDRLDRTSRYEDWEERMKRRRSNRPPGNTLPNIDE